LIERLQIGVPELDKILQGGIPRGFVVAVTGEPGTGKTILCLHFIAKGIELNEPAIYVTTEESRESIINQASQFGWDFRKAMNENKLIIIDALMRSNEDRWSINKLLPEVLIAKVIEAKKSFGYGHARLVIDSMSAFWLDKPVMARKYSYQVKRTLYKWNFTIMMTSQYAITTSDAFGFGIEHIADGIIRLRRRIVNNRLWRFLVIEKMRQTAHDTRVWEVDIVDKIGFRLIRPAAYSRADFSLPQKVQEKIIKAKQEAERT